MTKIKAQSNKRTIAFVVRGDPKSQKRHRMGRGFSYDPSKSDKANFMTLAFKHIPARPITSPIRFQVVYYMPIPKSWPKYRKLEAETDNIPHIKTPDIDNLVKLNLDALAPFWNDDKQVYQVTASKYYSHIPRTEVIITYLEQ